MKTQLKLTLPEHLAQSFEKTAQELGYLSTQEFIVESARKRDIAYRISGLKSLQGTAKQRFTKNEQEAILKEFTQEGSNLFRKLKRDFS